MFKLFLALIVASSAIAEPPFWKAKDKVYTRIQNREVIVSVKSIERPGSSFKNQLSMAGGGQAAAPCDYMFKVSQDYAPIAKSSGYMEDVLWLADERVLLARIVAYGYRAKIAVKLDAVKGEGVDPHLNFEVVKGPMTGMKGRFTFASAGVKKCDVGLAGEYGYDKFPIAQIFLRFGMEVMFQRMASRMRTYAEGRYGQSP